MEKINLDKKGILEKVAHAKEPNIAENTKYIENTYKSILDKFTQMDNITKELKLNILDFQIQEEKSKDIEKENKIGKKVPSFRIEVEDNSKNNQKNNNENFHSR